MAWFVSAVIEKINNNCYMLRIRSTWYLIWSVEDVYVFNTLEEAKAKLLEIRCKGELTIK